MKLKYGKLYTCEGFDPAGLMVSIAGQGWRFINRDTIFVLLSKEDDHYNVLLPEGLIARLYTNSKYNFKQVTECSTLANFTK